MPRCYPHWHILLGLPVQWLESQDPLSRISLVPGNSTVNAHWILRPFPDQSTDYSCFNWEFVISLMVVGLSPPVC
jgi:hypothetical protein